MKQDTFIVMSYYRNETFQNGECTYSMQACRNEIVASFPEIEINEASLLNRIWDVINGFVKTGSISKGMILLII